MSVAPSFAYQTLADTGFFTLKKQLETHPYSDRAWYQKHQWRRHGLFAHYSPQYPLWSDGAEKKRWIYIPRKRRIDTRDMEAWVFPVGTKIWKEFAFSVAGETTRLETRLMEKTGENDWLMITFVWNDAQTQALRAPAEGIKNHYALTADTYYDIPSEHDCQYCHAKAGLDIGPQSTPVLGFSALQLSGERDPDAIHGEAWHKGMLNLPRLDALRITTHPAQYQPKIPDSEIAPLQRQVFGYLHGNCGHCHNETGMGALTNTLDLSHRASATFIQQNGVYRSAIGKNITYYLAPPNSPARYIAPGDADDSAIIYRM
ncbi:MAG: hypothetical protein R3183_07245, partial [Oleiphilaceae bacterium]|nr:hypothetical protein [Oleiphilaceae bacterium]